MRPDAALFHQHVNGADFQAGVDRKSWGIHGEDPGYPEWPFLIIWVQALEKAGRPDRYYFRFDLSGYPSNAPTACPWDITLHARLENSRWPKGSKIVSPTFNYGWNANALYAPCDRIAMAGHDGWRSQFPELWWQSSFSITVYLHFLHRLLNSSDYANS